MTDMTGNFVSTFFVYTEYGEHSLRILFKMIKKRGWCRKLPTSN